MKITINDPQISIHSIVLCIEPETTLSDLILRVAKYRVACNLNPVYQYSYNNSPLLSTDLNKSLRELLGEGDEKILYVSSDVPKAFQYNLSTNLIEKHQQPLAHVKSSSIQPPSLSTYPSIPKIYNAGGRKQVLNQLCFFPAVLVDLIEGYLNVEREVGHDYFLVINVGEQLFNIEKKCREASGVYYHENILEKFIMTGDNNEKFFSSLALFFFYLYDFNQSTNLGITLLRSSFEVTEVKGRIFCDFTSAIASCRHPYISSDKSRTYVNDYEVIIHLSDKEEIRGVYCVPFLKIPSTEKLEEIKADEIKNNFIYVDLSSLSIPKDISLPNRTIPNVKASIADHILKKIITICHKRFPNGVFPFSLSVRHPYEEAALDYFLRNHVNSKDTHWDVSNTLDEIIEHALQSRNKWFFAKGSHTKYTLLLLLGKDNTWFNQQNSWTLKKALLNEVQLLHAAMHRDGTSTMTKGNSSSPNAFVISKCKP